ncbi:MAG: hypothetical protein Q7R53_00765 [bacterium]|nr:hypothetical protein [bacterium]
MQKLRNKKTIAICCSLSFFKKIFEIEKKLKELGFKIILPKTAREMQKTNNYDVSFYKTWYKNKSHYYKKKELMIDHFRKVIKSDAILVINEEKNGIKGYIGGNTLMEMTIAFHYKKPIFIYSEIDENLNIKEEVYGLNSIFIKEDLKILQKKLL